MSTSKKAWRRRVGRVTVYQRGGRFWIYYRDYRPVRRPVGTSREEALALAAKINAQLADGTSTMLAFQPIAVTAMIAKWLDHHEHIRRSAVNTVNRYRTAIEHLKRFIEANHPGLRADRFDSGMAEQFVRHLRTAKISPNGCKGATKRTMRDKGVIFTLETARALFNFGRDQRHLPAYAPNPFTSLAIERMPVDDAKPIRPMAPDQEREFFKACDVWQFRVFFLFAFTGLRVGELCHLLIDSDVDLDNNLIRITNKPRLYWQIKTRNLRDVPLLPEVAQVLRKCIGDRKTGPVILRRGVTNGTQDAPLTGRSMVQLEEEAARRIEAAQARQAEPLTRLETRQIGRSVWRDAGATKETKIRVEFMEVTKRVGLGHLTCPKDLRHLFATSLQAAGVDPMVRRDIMGHTSLEMTAHYTHTQNGTRQRELSRLTEIRGSVLELAHDRV